MTRLNMFKLLKTLVFLTCLCLETERSCVAPACIPPAERRTDANRQ
jgi:hypothetical protein